MRKLYRCKKVRVGDKDMLMSDAPHNPGVSRMYPVTYGKDLSGQMIEEHTFVAPPPPVKVKKQEQPNNPAEWQQWMEIHGQQKLL